MQEFNVVLVLNLFGFVKEKMLRYWRFTCQSNSWYYTKLKDKILTPNDPVHYFEIR